MAPFNIDFSHLSNETNNLETTILTSDRMAKPTCKMFIIAFNNTSVARKGPVYVFQGVESLRISNVIVNGSE